MVILGVLLIVVAVIVLVDMGVASNGTTDIHVLGWHLGTMGPGRVLLIGAAIGVVLTLGLVLVLSGQLRSRRKRRSRDKTIAGTRAENKRLAAQLEEQEARAAEATSRPTGANGQVSTGDVEAYPAEAAYPPGAEYVVGSRYPHETPVASTPPSTPNGSGR
jgi:uncharacterized membrane protein